MLRALSMRNYSGASKFARMHVRFQTTTHTRYIRSLILFNCYILYSVGMWFAQRFHSFNENGKKTKQNRYHIDDFVAKAANHHFHRLCRLPRTHLRRNWIPQIRTKICI